MKRLICLIKMLLIAGLMPLISCSKSELPDLPPLPEPKEDDGTRILQIDYEINAFMNNYNLPGLSLAISRNGKLVYAKGYGFADLENAIPLEPHHIIRIGSVSKPITAVSVLKLMEDGGLSLDDQVFGPDGILGTEYGDGNYSESIQQITVRDLLGHTSGGWVNIGGPQADPMGLNADWSQRQVIDYTINNYPLQHEPGQRHLYSNFGYCLLARIIEKITNKSYEEYVRTDVLTPMGITGMYVGGNTPQQRKEYEVVYYGDPGTDPYGPNISRMDAPGGWTASASDLVRFMLHVDGFSTVPDVLSSSTINMMTTPVAIEGNNNYGYGWRNNQGTWFHAGSVRGGGARITRTSSGFCWAIITNNRSNSTSFFPDMEKLIWSAINNPATPWPNVDLLNQ